MAYTAKLDSIENDYVILSTKAKGRWTPKRAVCDISGMQPGSYYQVELQGDTLTAWSNAPERSKSQWQGGSTPSAQSSSSGASRASDGVNWDMAWGSICNLAGQYAAAGKLEGSDALVAFINRLASVRKRLAEKDSGGEEIF